MGEHGLFGDEDAVDLNAAMAEVNSYTGNIWTHIISLRREDAERLGFDHADAWRALLRAHRNDIAEAMHIPPEDFRWYPKTKGRTLGRAHCTKCGESRGRFVNSRSAVAEKK